MGRKSLNVDILNLAIIPNLNLKLGAGQALIDLVQDLVDFHLKWDR